MRILKAREHHLGGFDLEIEQSDGFVYPYHLEDGRQDSLSRTLLKLIEDVDVQSLKSIEDENSKLRALVKKAREEKESKLAKEKEKLKKDLVKKFKDQDFEGIVEFLLGS